MEKIPQKSRLYVLLMFGMLFPSILLFTILADVPHVILFTIIGFVVSLCFSKPIKYSDRSVIYSLVVALAMAVLFDLVIPVDEDRLSIISGILRANLSVPFLAYLVVAVSFYESSSYTLAFSACFSLGILMIDGEMLSIYSGNERLPFIKELIMHSKLCYAIFVAVTAVLVMVSANVAWCIKGKRYIFRWQKYAITIVALIVLVGASAFSYKVFIMNQGKLKALEGMMLRMGMRRNRKLGRIIFDSNIDLHRTIDPSIEQNSAQIILRAQAKQPPGYLRGRAYSDYDHGRWLNIDDKNNNKMKYTGQEGALAYRTYYLKEKTPDKNSINIITASNFTTNVLLLPGNIGQVDLVANLVKYSNNGTFFPEEWQRDGGYTAYVNQVQTESAFPEPVKIDDSLQAVPDYMQDELKTILKKALPQDKKLTNELMVGFLIKYFRDNFQYSLKTDYRSEDEPVLTFLTKTQKGHCELFATAMTLLLRSKGIPARYITGFICEEQHPSGSYYVSRLGNAHAWCEAYLPDKKKWILVEPTPPTDIPNFKHEWGTFESWTDYLKQMFQQILANMRRGYFAKAIIGFFSGLFGFIWYAIWNPIRGPIILALIAWIILHFRKRWKMKHDPSRVVTYSQVIHLLQKEIALIERYYRKKTGHARPKSSTLNEYLKQLPTDSDSIHAKFADTIKQYQQIRYSPNHIPDNVIEKIISLRKEFSRTK